jgi:hypothetical protein
VAAPISSAHISVALENSRPVESKPRESITPAAAAAAAAAEEEQVQSWSGRAGG